MLHRGGDIAAGSCGIQCVGRGALKEQTGHAAVCSRGILGREADRQVDVRLSMWSFTMWTHVEI